MRKNKHFEVERTEKWGGGWWVKDRTTHDRIAFSSDLHGAISISQFMDQSRNIKSQER